MSRKRASLIVLFAASALSATSVSALSAEVCNPNQPLSGAQLFADHCAKCHGAEATGGKTPSGTPAPDLTVLKRQSNGEFPASRVAEIIRYGGALPDHSINPQMPTWAKIFAAECGPTYSRRVIVELMKHVEEIQK
jgi:mono/diheme cytochrome c family protein